MRGRPETGSREAERVETSPAGALESSHWRLETKAEGRAVGASEGTQRQPQQARDEGTPRIII